jgi:hypothetical protein
MNPMLEGAMNHKELGMVDPYLDVYDASVKDISDGRIKNKYIELTTMTSICTKRYVTKPLSVAVSPTISTGRIPEVTAQNIPKSEDKIYSINRIKDYVPLMIIEIKGVFV